MILNKFVWLQVRELQRITHAVVKIPDDPSTTGDETIVRIHGNFQASQVGSFLTILP